MSYKSSRRPFRTAFACLLRLWANPLARRRRLTALEADLATLAPAEREVFLLHCRDGLPLAAVAATRETSVAAAEDLLVNALLHLANRECGAAAASGMGDGSPDELDASATEPN